MKTIKLKEPMTPQEWTEYQAKSHLSTSDGFPAPWPFKLPPIVVKFPRDGDDWFRRETRRIRWIIGLDPVFQSDKST